MVVHYMPWYETPAVSGNWGWHWTMNRFDPERVNADGSRQIASHQYPLIEPYDSNDPDALECHVLLMKFAGIDGLVVDWYGAEAFNDYATLHRNTRAIIHWARRAGLRFAICFEDRAVRSMVQGGRLKENEAVPYGRAVMRFMETEWFRDPLYLRLEGKPVLLIFGPDYFTDSQLEEVISSLPERPVLATLHERRAPADGAFAWLPMWESRDGILSREGLNTYFAAFSRKSREWGVSIAAAFPGFHDIYEQAGVHPSYGYLDARRGETFRETLRTALESGADLIQLVTWNDYGEGTAIEPTTEDGYHSLEMVQDANRSRVGNSFGYQPDDLRLPVRLYRLRKRHGADSDAARELAAISNCLFESDLAGARERLSQFADEP